MTWKRSSSHGDPPPDPVGDVIAETLLDLMPPAEVELSYTRVGDPAPAPPDGWAAATGDGPPGWRLTVIVRPAGRIAPLVDTQPTFKELVSILPEGTLRAADVLRLREVHETRQLGPLEQRLFRDEAAASALALYLCAHTGCADLRTLIEETIEFLIELSGTRVESQNLTHGVVITDYFADKPRLTIRYPAHVSVAKRAPLLFDGQRSVLVVDFEGRARTEVQRHRLDRFAKPGGDPVTIDGLRESGSLVAAATRVVGGLGLFLRADRSIWAFVDGRPLIVRRGERWIGFPLLLGEALAAVAGGGAAARMVADAAFTISAQPHGAILAIVDDASVLDGIVPLKDRYDLRNELDPAGMRIETRLHHLIDAENLDDQTLARLATLDGATILDRNGKLLAYGAVVSSFDSQHEGARTAAARTLSEIALVVVMVSVDGDITIFRNGTAAVTLLRGGVSIA
jgi:hypothetical protein